MTISTDLPASCQIGAFLAFEDDLRQSKDFESHIQNAPHKYFPASLELYHTGPDTLIVSMEKPDTWVVEYVENGLKY